MLCDCLSVQVLSMRLIGFYIESESMGSLGWAQCYWCVSWQFNMYIPDGVDAPLCEWCLDRFAHGYGPSWRSKAWRSMCRMPEIDHTAKSTKSSKRMLSTWTLKQSQNIYVRTYVRIINIVREPNTYPNTLSQYTLQMGIRARGVRQKSVRQFYVRPCTSIQ